MLMNTNMGNAMGQQVNMVPQNPNNQMNTATNLLQNLNQRPNQNQMQNIQNKMPGMIKLVLKIKCLYRIEKVTFFVLAQEIIKCWAMYQCKWEIQECKCLR